MSMRHRLASAVVRMAARTAPSDRRASMIAEWDAEVTRELAQGRGWSVVLASFGAFADARELRALDRGVGAGSGRWATDLRIAMRGLAKAPGFTAVSVLTLAIGLGSVGTVYTLLDRIVLDPLPYPESERLVQLRNQVPGVGPDAMWHLSTAQWVHFTESAASLDAVGLYRGEGANVMGPSGPIRARIVTVTASVLPMLGAQALHGRILTEADDVPTAEPVAVVSHALWRDALGADPSAVGTVLRLDGRPVEIVGVLEPGVRPPGFATMEPDIWTPLRIDRGGSFGNSHVFPAIGRLSEGATPEGAEAELARLTPPMAERFPVAYSAEFFERYGFRTVAIPLRTSVVGEMKTTLWVLFGGVFLVLLVACANVSNLFVVRVEGRRRELSVRRALGADRASLARFILSESLVLALVGGAFAVVAGVWAIPALVRFAPEGLPRIGDVGLGIETVAFIVSVSIAVGLVVALYPLLTGAPDPSELTGSARGSTQSAGRQRFRSALVATQMALAVTLIVGAGLLLQGLETLRASDPGFEPEGALAVELYASPERYPDDLALWALHREILDAVRALPGVTAVGMGEEVPVTGSYGCTVQGFADTSVHDRIADAGMTTCAGQQRVTPGYFEALGIPLLEGRYLEAGDIDDPRRAAVVVSRAFAERFWPDGSWIGRGVAPSGRTVPPFYEVVGVVDDVARASDAGAAPLSQQAIAIYYPSVRNPDTPGNWSWWWPGAVTLVVRTSVDPAALVPGVRRAVAAVDPEIPVANARPMSESVGEATAGVAFLSTLMIVAALAALLLAAVGLYGVVSWVVSRRTREIGMRLAIGAAPSTVVRAVVASTMRLALGGLIVGLPLAYVGSRVSESVLVGVEPTAPLAYLGAAAIVVSVSALAAWMPARRAAGIDPARALRAE